jgi:hypothetical protein
MKRLFVICFACLFLVGCNVRKYSRVEIYASAPLVKTCDQSWVERDYIDKETLTRYAAMAIQQDRPLQRGFGGNVLMLRNINGKDIKVFLSNKDYEAFMDIYIPLKRSELFNEEIKE